MPIQVRCPQGHSLAVAEKYAGLRVKCPRCQTPLMVPTNPGTSAAAASNGARRADGSHDDRSGVPQPPPIPKPPIAAPPLAPPLPPPAPTVVATVRPTPETPAPIPRLRAWAEEGVRGYRAERSRISTVYFLTLGIVLMACFQLVPASSHLAPSTAPGWARWLMMLALIQFAYAIWMVSFPDWSTVRTMMIALAAVATLYGVALGIATVTPREKPLPFDMNDVRDKVRLWCGAVLLLLGLLTYACGRVAYRWRKDYRTLTAFNR